MQLPRAEPEPARGNRLRNKKDSEKFQKQRANRWNF